jgi:hypothetical protein
VNFRDDSEPLLHKQAQVRSDLETFDVPWTPEEDEAFRDLPGAFRCPTVQCTSPPAPGPARQPSSGPGATGDELPEAV